MATTPEGRIKARVTQMLQDTPDLFYWMPVQTGYGRATLDYVGCYFGYFFAVETKVVGKNPTPRQEVIIKEIADAGGKVFVIRTPNDLLELSDWLFGILTGRGTP